jgi:hypothetical protein
MPGERPLWDFAAGSLAGREVAAYRGAAAAAAVLRDGDLTAELLTSLSPGEVDATRQRLELLLKHRVHPYPPEDWPAVPWPPV